LTQDQRPRNRVHDTVTVDTVDDDAFDRLFLQLMITHHQGAVQMADTELSQCVGPDAQALAASIKRSNRGDRHHAAAL
jgi:uncharacterized protein (DUF305 family)